MTDIWPVIHLSDNEGLTVQNARVAARCGCPGVFLISMSGNDELLDPAAKLIRREVPALKIGINALMSDPGDAVRRSLNHGYDATWSDYAWQHTDVDRLIKINGGEHKFFAAVAFKGETHNEADPHASAREAVARGFIPMTSGSGTGVTAPFEKIERLRGAIGPGVPLAMSGVNPHNTAARLAPLVTHFLVATCISRDFYTFDEAMLRYLITQTNGEK